MKFNDKEISLCKQIAEKHEKEIDFGDWYHDKDSDDIFLCEEINGQHIFPNLIPLWTISDCLEFFKERGWGRIIIDMDKVGGVIKIFHDKGFRPPIIQNGLTVLEFCLKAVLAVIEEGE